MVVALVWFGGARWSASEPVRVDALDMDLVAEPGDPTLAPPASSRSIGDGVETETAAPTSAAPAARSVTASPPAAADGQAAPAPDDGMIRATRLLSAAVLASPRSRRAREDLRRMGTEERVVQLCDLEALEQIHTWNAAYRPETVLAHALGEVRVSGRTVAADGGAFAAGGRWYGVAFRCEASVDLERVVAFAFRVGAEIPKREWRRYDLPAPGGSLD